MRASSAAGISCQRSIRHTYRKYLHRTSAARRVNNCIGHFNYRHFVLFVLYLCLGAGYAACSAWGRMSMRETSAQDMGWLIIVFALSASTAFALVILFAWHAYLICSAQVRSTLIVGSYSGLHSEDTPLS